MSDPETLRERAELRQLLMVEVTARLEDLAARAAEAQLAAAPARSLAEDVVAVSTLLAAHAALIL